ncbi:MAG TPA: twin-arginine translocase TatA/TatE family subunit [Xanthomonadaceae bacterium]|jgi:sec-independent protein translocase protein TatA
MGSFSIWHLLLILLIALIIFGTKRLTGGAKDIGTAVKEFKKAMADDPEAAKKTDPVQPTVDPLRPPPPADVTRVERPPSPNPPGNDQRPPG